MIPPRKEGKKKEHQACNTFLTISNLAAHSLTHYYVSANTRSTDFPREYGGRRTASFPVVYTPIHDGDVEEVAASESVSVAT